MNEADVLAVDPFAGDFGMPGDRTLKNKMVTARKAGECNLCGGQTVPGTRVRVMTEKFEGRLEYYRWCHECCVAMEKSWHDEGEAYEARAALRIANQPIQQTGCRPSGSDPGKQISGLTVDGEELPPCL